MTTDELLNQWILALGTIALIAAFVSLLHLL